MEIKNEQFEKEREKAAIKGFKHKDYGLIVEFLHKWYGSEDMQLFLQMSKTEKRVFCARWVYINTTNEKLKIKAKKWKGKTYLW